MNSDGNQATNASAWLGYLLKQGTTVDAMGLTLTKV
jgi:hypothetical protein